eukprot:6264643-Amphidinium_carterae.1
MDSAPELEVLISVGLVASWAQLPDAAQAILDKWTLDGHYSNPALRAKAGLMVRVCRVACGLPGDYAQHQASVPAPVQFMPPPPPIETLEQN